MKKILLLFLVIFITACKSPETLFNNLVVRAYHERITGVACASAVLIDCIKQDENRYELVFLSCKHFLPQEELLDLKTDIIFVQFFSGSDQPVLSKKVEKIIYHPTLDITLLIAENDSFLEPSKINVSSPAAAEKVVAVGFPLGIGMLITEGHICYDLVGQSISVCSAPIYPGNSGGGVFYIATKELVGITIQLLVIPSSRGETLATHVHMFIPLVFIKDWLEKAYEKD
jgi:hypothetical protein